MIAEAFQFSFDRVANLRGVLRFSARTVLLTVLCLAGFTALAEPVASTNLVIPNLNAATSQSALPDTGASVLRVFGALILVVGIFLGGVWLFKNWQRFTVQKGAQPRLNVLEAKSIGQRQSILVVAYQQQRMLLAATPAGITLLSHLPAEENVESAPATATRFSFADAFQQVLARKQ